MKGLKINAIGDVLKTLICIYKKGAVNNISIFLLRCCL